MINWPTFHCFVLIVQCLENWFLCYQVVTGWLTGHVVVNMSHNVQLVTGWLTGHVMVNMSHNGQLVIWWLTGHVMVNMSHNG